MHPELGWVPRRNIRLTNEQGDTYSTNSLGFRSAFEFEVDDEQRFTVMIVGDSYTYGSHADDAEAWPAILQGMDADLQVLNLGVGGYGTDQMYLMLKNQIAHFRPDLVIAAFIQDDLHRSTLSFRGFQKPKFAIEGGELVLTNTPIPDLDTVARRVSRETRLKRALTKSKLINLGLNAWEAIRPDRWHWREVEAINDKIFAEMASLCEAHDAAFLVVYLPVGSELKEAGPKSKGEMYFERLIERTGLDGVNPRPRFLASGSSYSRNHYRRPAATVVAEAVYEKLATFPELRSEQDSTGE